MFFNNSQEPHILIVVYIMTTIRIIALSSVVVGSIPFGGIINIYFTTQDYQIPCINKVHL